MHDTGQRQIIMRSAPGMRLVVCDANLTDKITAAVAAGEHPRRDDK